MFRCWMDTPRECRWTAEANECTWAATAQDVSPIVRSRILDAGGGKVHKTPRAEGFKVLGSLVSFDWGNDVDLEHRTLKMWQALYLYKPVLCNRKVPILKRLLLAEHLLDPAMFWGSGAWTLRQCRMQRLDALQRQVHGTRRQAGEEAEVYMRRIWTRVAASQRQAPDEPWSKVYLGGLYTWDGHIIARFWAYDAYGMSGFVVEGFSLVGGTGSLLRQRPAGTLQTCSPLALGDGPLDSMAGLLKLSRRIPNICGKAVPNAKCHHRHHRHH
eukprot:1150402-Amphidinium_carterae.1